jgi:hypothetical protein
MIKLILKVHCLQSLIPFTSFILKSHLLSATLLAKNQQTQWTPLSKAITHPSFNDANVDITLTSQDGTVFRVKSTALSAASPWFCALLSLPQGNSQDVSLAWVNIITTLETTQVISGLLSVIT